MGFKPDKTYKYHSSLIKVVTYDFKLFSSVHFDIPSLNIPLSVKYIATDSTTLILYNKNNVLDLPINVISPKPINWKLHFQRHQVNKFFKITG